MERHTIAVVRDTRDFTSSKVHIIMYDRIVNAFYLAVYTRAVMSLDQETIHGKREPILFTHPWLVAVFGNI